MSCWRGRNAAADLPQPAAAGRRSAPQNKIKTCLHCVLIILGALLCGYAFFRLADDAAGYYVVTISIADASGLPATAANGRNTTSPSPPPPSFNVTVGVENHYHHHICFSDWGVAVSYDGVPLGRATFPDDLCALSMGGGDVTAATASGLVGLDGEVRGRMARRGQTWGDADLQIDMRHHVLLADSGADEWLRCTTRLDGQPTSTPCKFEVASRS
ncbi:unnamed protein product [Urochloa decumbens]|uniref:Late embryogenesis abundant protein LEA-2 subgroup domain-containing protein n=1 Tax=Urochloa decumbens TaxID=240449 RepID=A0ABC9AA63_9POAL